MTDIPRVEPHTVRQRLQQDTGTLLVCAYDDDQKCRDKHLEGAIPLSELQRRQVAKDTNIVFYCA